VKRSQASRAFEDKVREMFLWDESEATEAQEDQLLERVTQEILSGRWPVLVTQDEMAEETSRG
jgi:hypothetical protein